MTQFLTKFNIRKVEGWKVDGLSLKKTQKR
jgi:hypothetical protein